MAPAGQGGDYRGTATTQAVGPQSSKTGYASTEDPGLHLPVA
jgi:hypothetical protein